MKDMLMRQCRAFIAVVLILSGCSSPPGEPPPDLTLLHLNDTYRIDAVEEGRRGGFGRVATLAKRLAHDGRDLRLTHGGDFLYPSLESQLWAGEQMVEALNYLDGIAPLYVVPGNHELDPRTPDSLIERMQQSTFDWLGDNIVLDTGNTIADGALQRRFVFESGGRRIGVFALMLDADDGGNERPYARVDGDYVELARQAIEALEAERVDLIFGLTHLLLAHDRQVARLRAEHPTFRFILGGHEHEPEYEEGDADNAIIMKGASNARTIWQVDIRFGGAGEPARIDTTVVNIDDSIPDDPVYQAIAERWRERLLETAPFLPARVGVAAVPLDGREVTIRNEESNWADFIVDQMRGAFGEPAADLAFLNSGTLRLDDWVAEDITFEDIGRTFGFSSHLRRMTIRGGEFRRLLEAGFRGSGPSKGYFPQVSGFRVCIGRSRAEGERIVQLQVPEDGSWSEIDANRQYSLVAPDYIYRGGDGYDFSAARDVSRPASELKYLVLDAILRAQAKGERIGAAIDPEARRIAFLQDGEERCFD